MINVRLEQEEDGKWTSGLNDKHTNSCLGGGILGT